MKRDRILETNYQNYTAAAAVMATSYLAQLLRPRTEFGAVVRAFAAREIVPHIAAWEAAREVPRAAYAAAGQIGEPRPVMRCVPVHILAAVYDSGADDGAGFLGAGFPESVGGTPCSFSSA